MKRSDYAWIDSRVLRMSCLECGETFEAARRDAKYCGSACRRKAARREAKIPNLTASALTAIQALKWISVIRPDLAVEIDESLNLIYRELGVTLR